MRSSEWEIEEGGEYEKEENGMREYEQRSEMEDEKTKKKRKKKKQKIFSPSFLIPSHLFLILLPFYRCRLPILKARVKMTLSE